ncbi:MAG: CMP-N,N'-diacetyllegionaminic acid synthase [uncultured marine phage]|uniref:CMP-N,N'-diacetyllegionaminic acid synthase n=1 Tax=uncultured marine phage TaxID=707152 RepID=A0A8D9C9R3_9VIRU|nr:MAG: CMP-N,N'-diacetyllegionaminic acid synthase [uncultured marine phage]
MKFFIIIKEKSERVPDKNFIDFGGKPLWRHLVDELKGEEVFIDTDSKIIIDETSDINYVTSYPRSDDHINLEIDSEFGVSPVLLMIERFLDEYVEDENEIIVTPHVTSPFITKETILKASEYLNEYDSVQACTEHKEFTYFKGEPVNFDPNCVQKTQDLEPVMMGNGAFFIFTKKTFKKFNNRSGEKIKFYPLNFRESIEIDYPEDLEIAKKFLKK